MEVEQLWAADGQRHKSEFCQNILLKNKTAIMVKMAGGSGNEDLFDSIVMADER